MSREEKSDKYTNQLFHSIAHVKRISKNFELFRLLYESHEFEQTQKSNHALKFRHFEESQPFSLLNPDFCNFYLVII
jgi:hypothetical protein